MDCIRLLEDSKRWLSYEYGNEKSDFGKWWVHSGRWNDNIKVDFRGIGVEAMDSIRLPEDANRWLSSLNMVIKYRILENAENFVSGLAAVGFPKMTQLHCVRLEVSAWLPNINLDVIDGRNVDCYYLCRTLISIGDDGEM
jgi:hypothetical protein